MNNLDIQYINLCKSILDNGNIKDDRTGTGTISTFGNFLDIDILNSGFPLLTTKKMAFKQIASELIWFLKGDTNIRYLLENRNYIWVGDAYKNYCKKCGEPVSRGEFIQLIISDDEFSQKWGELGPIYGFNWRNFGGKYDQIQEVLNLLTNNRDSRRILVNAWDPNALAESILPPCHVMFQFYVRELKQSERFNIYNKPHHDFIEREMDAENVPTHGLSLLFYMRSSDVPLGLPFNIASYALLLDIIAKHLNMAPDRLKAATGDTHIYNNQIEGVKEQIERVPFDTLPKLVYDRKDSIFDYVADDFKIVEYNCHPKIEFPLSN